VAASVKDVVWPTLAAAMARDGTVGPTPSPVRLETHDGGGCVDRLPRTVLLVDDDADMRLYLRSCLRGLALPFDHVIEAADGLEALRLVRSGAVDVVISDVGLPGLDGRRLSRAIRDDAALRHVSVLLISGDGVLGESTADAFLMKPFNSHQLLAALGGLASRAPTAP
jgi:CheY-like chemotaxis protein